MLILFSTVLNFIVLPLSLHKQQIIYEYQYLFMIQITSAMQIKLAVYYVTVPNMDIGMKISEALLNQQLIACCNIVDKVQSVYEWKGKVENEEERLMIMKSRQSYMQKIIQVVIKNHPYDVPEVIAMPIIGGYGKYLQWVIESTEPKQKEKL